MSNLQRIIAARDILRFQKGVTLHKKFLNIILREMNLILQRNVTERLDISVIYNALSLFALVFTGEYIDVYIRSEGCEDFPRIDFWCRAYIFVNGSDESLRRRGYNVVVVDGTTGNVKANTQSFVL